MTERHKYSTRSAAVRAARNACRKALDSEIYQAFEGPDFEIHPADRDDHLWLTDYRGPSFYILRGPAKEASS